MSFCTTKVSRQKFVNVLFLCCHFDGPYTDLNVNPKFGVGMTYARNFFGIEHSTPKLYVDHYGNVAHQKPHGMLIGKSHQLFHR